MHGNWTVFCTLRRRFAQNYFRGYLNYNELLWMQGCVFEVVFANSGEKVYNIEKCGG